MTEITKIIKSELIYLSIFGYGNASIERNERFISMYEGFQQILKDILPIEIGFKQFIIRGSNDIVFQTNTGEFLLDSVSGGISSLILMAWQIFMYSCDLNQDEEFTILIDEPEIHLHPGMQRNILPNLLRGFPNARFIIASHSPLIISSIQDASIYVLNFNNQNLVESLLLSSLNNIRTANGILRDVLGLSNTYPVWAEKKIEEIVQMYLNKPMNEESYSQLKSEMNELGLENWFPATLSRLIEGHDSTI